MSGFIEHVYGLGVHFTLYHGIALAIALGAWVILIGWYDVTEHPKQDEKSTFWTLKIIEVYGLFFIIEGIRAARAAVIAEEVFTGSIETTVFGTFFWLFGWLVVIGIASFIIGCLLFCFLVTKALLNKENSRKFLAALAVPFKWWIQWNQNISRAIVWMGFVEFWKEPFTSYSAYLSHLYEKERDASKEEKELSERLKGLAESEYKKWTGGKE